ncbi:MAG TPA: beta-L-arabinofuranosidase domain-containing protein [Cellulomonas sp.]
MRRSSGTGSPPAPGTDGPLAATVGDAALWRPLALDAVRLAPGGLLGDWQAVNGGRTVPHCLAQLDAAGTIDNFRRVTGEHAGPFAGPWFADSDLYKTLEAVAWEQARGGEDRTAYVARTTALLAAVQQPDGYLNSYYQTEKPAAKLTELRDGHELYCLGHLIQAAVAWYRATGEHGLLDVAQRSADLLVRRFGPGADEGCCGHPEIETALVELFRTTRQRDYLDLALRMVDLRGRRLFANDHNGPRYYQDHEPVRTATEATGHAVRQIYLATGVADLYLETGDPELLAYCVRIWESAHGSKMYLTGGFGARHRDESFGDPYELPAERAYAETCAAIADVMWGWRMLLATGEGRYADAMERALYNAVAVGASRHGDTFFYSNPLQVRSTHAEDTDWSSFTHRVPWFDCACCPPNLGRLIASVQHYVATQDGSGVQLHLYADADVAVDGGVLTVRTGYPWDGAVRIEVPAALGGRTVRLRRPGWARTVRLRVDGVEATVPVEAGYLVVPVPDGGALLDLDLDLAATVVAPHPHVDAVRGQRAVLRGPLVYALEQVDLPAGVVLEDVLLDPSAPIEVDGGVDGLDVPVTLLARGTVRASGGGALYPPDQGGPDGTLDAGGTAVRLRLVPYYRWGNRGPGAMRVWSPVPA